jgi:hypothetical protein
VENLRWKRLLSRKPSPLKPALAAPDAKPESHQPA